MTRRVNVRASSVGFISNNSSFTVIPTVTHFFNFTQISISNVIVFYIVMRVLSRISDSMFGFRDNVSVFCIFSHIESIFHTYTFTVVVILNAIVIFTTVFCLILIRCVSVCNMTSSISHLSRLMGNQQSA